jgi:hypothetical protein
MKKSFFNKKIEVLDCKNQIENQLKMFFNAAIDGEKK